MPTPSANEGQQIITEKEAIELDRMEKAGQTAQNPEDLHAQMFYLYMPIFRRHLEHLNKKALIRLIGALVEVPLNEKEIKSRSKVEQNAFQIGDQLLTSKYVMMILTDANQKMDAAQKEAAKKAGEMPIVLDKVPESVVESKLTSEGTIISNDDAEFLEKALKGE
jgi:hypothetical protein